MKLGLLLIWYIRHCAQRRVQVFVPGGAKKGLCGLCLGRGGAIFHLGRNSRPGWGGGNLQSPKIKSIPKYNVTFLYIFSKENFSQKTDTHRAHFSFLHFTCHQSNKFHKKAPHLWTFSQGERPLSCPLAMPLCSGHFFWCSVAKPHFKI